MGLVMRKVFSFMVSTAGRWAATRAMWPGREYTAIRQRGRVVNERSSAVRSLAVVEYLSLDGVIQAPGHADEDGDGGFAHGGWTGGFMADHQRYNSQLFPAAGAFLLGGAPMRSSPGTGRR